MVYINPTTTRRNIVHGMDREQDHGWMARRSILGEDMYTKGEVDNGLILGTEKLASACVVRHQRSENAEHSTSFGHAS
jgi:hypothetical protein